MPPLPVATVATANGINKKNRIVVDKTTNKAMQKFQFIGNGRARRMRRDMVRQLRRRDVCSDLLELQQ